MGKKNIPKTVGFILDGNRRWAKTRKLPVRMWHREGAENAKRIIRIGKKAGVRCIYFYLFSTENWYRGKLEVAVLLALLETWLGEQLDDFVAEGVRIRIIGERHRFSKKMQDLFHAAERRTARGRKVTVVCCLSYGGRAEILASVRHLLKNGRRTVSEKDIAGALWSAGLPDPDLIIRTGGAHRLSNFLTWQSVYSELYFTDTYWPDLSEKEFVGILEEVGSRERRFGT